MMNSCRTIVESASCHTPQRMSVASAASHIRDTCAPSSMCKLGSPIMIQTPAQQAEPASDSHRIQAQPKDCSLYQAVSRSPCLAAPAPDSAPLMTPHSLRRTSTIPSRAIASSMRIVGTLSAQAHDRTPPRFDRSQSARKPTLATSPTIPLRALSFIQNDSSSCMKQDVVYTALTHFRQVQIAESLIDRSNPNNLTVSGVPGESPAIRTVGFVEAAG
jgi:hypothetical protein